MTFAVVAVAAFGLLVLPGVTERYGARLAPREWAWLCALALGSGIVLIEAALVLRAAPGVLDAAGVEGFAAACARVVEPLLAGGPVVTWVAAAGAVGLAVAAGRAVCRARRGRRRLAEDLWLGGHRRIAGHDVVILPVDRPFAASFDDGTATIVLSDGLLDRLGADEIDAVVRHEAAHLAHRHQRLLTVAAAVEPLLGRLPGVRRSLAALHLALERGADEDAASASPDGRDTVRRGLLRLLELPAPPTGAAAFLDARTVAARVRALADPPPPATTAAHVGLYIPGLAACALVVPGLYQWGDQLRVVAAMAGSCAL